MALAGSVVGDSVRRRLATAPVQRGRRGGREAAGLGDARGEGFVGVLPRRATADQARGGVLLCVLRTGDGGAGPSSRLGQRVERWTRWRAVVCCAVHCSPLVPMHAGQRRPCPI
jgi:hypothetical protein